jgi:hypothetical protein
MAFHVRISCRMRSGQESEACHDDVSHARIMQLASSKPWICNICKHPRLLNKEYYFMAKLSFRSDLPRCKIRSNIMPHMFLVCATLIYYVLL